MALCTGGFSWSDFMINKIGNILFILNIIEILALAVATVYFLIRRKFRSLVRINSLLAGIIIFTFTLWWAIFLRDGIGPGLIDSTGITALDRIFNSYSFHIIFGFTCLIIGIIIFKSFKEREHGL